MNHLELAKHLAQQAGVIMRQNFTIGMKKEWKEDSTPVTVTDKTINTLVIETISKELPSHGVLGEEQSTDLDREYVWVVDPVDGTMPFSHGSPTFMFSLALTHLGKPILGVMYDPIVDRLLWAELGTGAYLNGTQITVSKANTISQTMINLDADILPPQFRKTLNDMGAWCATYQSTVYGSMLVACGEFTAEIYAYNKPWDAAAVKIVVEEAGGIVTDLYGNEQRYDKEIQGFIATNRQLHPLFVTLLSQK